MSIRDFFFRQEARTTFSTKEINICELADFNEVQLRILAFNTCVNLIAGAVAKCDFKTFKDGKENKGDEWYLLNVEPNPNQNSSEFFHKLIHKLYKNGEALVVDNGSRSKEEYLAVADSFVLEEALTFRERRYTNVVLDGTTMNKAYRESEVLHFKLNEEKIKPVLDGIMISYEKLWNTARSTYAFANGVHLKDHISTIGNYDDEQDFNAKYMEMLNQQVKPFLTSTTAVLPEFDGHDYSVMELSNGATDTRDIKELTQDIFEFTAKSLGIPPVLVSGTVAGVDDIVQYFLTFCIDPLLYMIQEEFNRKRYGKEDLKKGTMLVIDSSTIQHIDMFKIANNVEKLIGSGYATINETRIAGGLMPSDDKNADKLFITKNFAEMTTLKGGE